MTATQFVNVAMPKMVPGLSAVVNSPPQLLMEWLDEGGRGPMKVDDWRTKPCPSRRALAYETMPVPEGRSDSSLARSAWKTKKPRTVPEGRSDSSLARSAWKTKKPRPVPEGRSDGSLARSAWKTKKPRTVP
jgi:hypothetical protein